MKKVHDNYAKCRRKIQDLKVAIKQTLSFLIIVECRIISLVLIYLPIGMSMAVEYIDKTKASTPVRLIMSIKADKIFDGRCSVITASIKHTTGTIDHHSIVLKTNLVQAVCSTPKLIQSEIKRSMNCGCAMKQIKNDCIVIQVVMKIQKITFFIIWFSAVEK